MGTPVRVVGWLYLVVGALYLFFALFFVRFSDAGASVPNTAVGALAPPLSALAVFFPTLGTAGSLAVLGLGSIAIGSGVLRAAPWARVAGLAYAALYVLNLSAQAPGAGLLLGVFTFVVLALPATDRLFRREAAGE